MAEFLFKIIDNGNLIDIISCVFTVLALMFTLYFWLLDQLSEEESKFIENKASLLKSLNKNLALLSPTNQDVPSAQDMLYVAESVNEQLEVVLNYRFWSRGKQRDEFAKVYDFFRDSRYLVSTLQRVKEQNGGRETAEKESLVAISALKPRELSDIRAEYQKGLSYTIEFFENWI